MWKVIPIEGTFNSHVIPMHGKEHDLLNPCWCLPEIKKEIYKGKEIIVYIHKSNQ